MLLRPAEGGLYCEAGDFYIDPWQVVDRAVITHAHGDHARWGSNSYLCSREGLGVLRTRLGPAATIRAADWGEAMNVNGVRVVLEDGTWGLVRASSNKPELVVVVESPVSEANMRAIFADIDATLSKFPDVGAYNQKI